MRNYEEEVTNRVKWIKDLLDKTKAKGIILGNSGGKDCALVAILSKMAAENTISVIMPCLSEQNYTSDKEHALLLSKQYNIKTITSDLSETKETLLKALEYANLTEITKDASKNINPRLRMTTLYALAMSLGYLVAGTGNKSEYFTGYFTKWGDGAYDFNPIRDLTATEVFEFLRFLKAPKEIIEKAPSAGLFEGQTDEMEMGVSYDAIDSYISTRNATKENIEKIEKMHTLTEHKRNSPPVYPNKL